MFATKRGTIAMTFEEAIALQPQWVQIWLNLLLGGAFILPIALLISRQSRVAGIVTLIVSLTAGFAVMWLFDRLGYVKLLGLPHILLWTPLVIYLFGQFRRPDMPQIPKVILGLVLATILISLAFDYVDVLRYILGERGPSV